MVWKWARQVRGKLCNPTVYKEHQYDSSGNPIGTGTYLAI
jgi:hypothetical protein